MGFLRPFRYEPDGKWDLLSTASSQGLHLGEVQKYPFARWLPKLYYS
jgi:hypothetical protein